MDSLSLIQITQSQLISTPIVAGQLVITTDTGNIYRDFSGTRVPLGKDIFVVDELPIAPITGKVYLLKPNYLYIYDSGWILINDYNAYIQDLIDRIENLENIIHTGKIVMDLYTNNNELITTNSGDEICVWFKY